MQQKSIEIGVGLFLVLAALALFVLAFQVSGLGSLTSPSQSYQVSAAFDNIGDLRVHAPVSIGGVRIGEVSHITLDPQSFKAIVTLRLQVDQNKIPQDSTASIFTQGLLGSNYINITPGFSDTNLKNNDKITSTHSAIILENLIGQLMFKLNSPKSD